jgi:hypothetical protein
MIALGKKAKDKITGFEGVVMARTEYLTGCARVSLQSEELKDGKPLEWVAFDEEQCVELEPEPLDLEMEDPGGPRPDTAQKPDAAK